MTLHEPDIRQAQLNAVAHFADPHRVARPLLSVACIDAAGICILGAAAWGVAPATWRPALAAVRESGAIGVVLAALVLTFGAALSCLIMTGNRRRAIAAPGHFRWPRRVAPVAGNLARAAPVIVAAGCSIAVLVVLRSRDPAAAIPATATWFALAGASILAAFPLLIAERVLDAIPGARLPELPHLKPFAVLPIACLVLFAATDVAGGLGLDLTVAAAKLLAAGLVVVSAELALRAGLAVIVPTHDRVQARAPIDSALLRMLGPALGRPASWSAVMRERFGIDFGRSWALRYVRHAAVPIVAVLAVFCVFLSGVTRIDSNERGVYQRLGQPVAVLRPGLHLILPWPLGQIRRTEYGVVHAVPILYADGAPALPAALQPAADDGTSTAEGAPPASANRLWDAEQLSDVSYIISSDSGGRQSFETISASVRVLYRIGLDDASARHAVYAVTDHDTVVRTLAGQVLARYLASRTLPQILGEDRTSITRNLQSGLQRMLDDIGAGVEVVSVIVEAIHPPGGAAEAYRNVQAAEIQASTEISVEQGRAKTTASLAQRDADTALGKARAAAAERLSAAEVVRTNFASDVAAYHASGNVFVLERYLAQLSATLHSASVEILDHRLGAADGPTLDLRPFDRIGDAAPPRNGHPAKNGEAPQ
jgi:regulator of protease activity HflC (stomatin/prohibitin superfamily)